MSFLRRKPRIAVIEYNSYDRSFVIHTRGVSFEGTDVIRVVDGNRIVIAPATNPIRMRCCGQTWVAYFVVTKGMIERLRVAGTLDPETLAQLAQTVEEVAKRHGGALPPDAKTLKGLVTYLLNEIRSMQQGTRAAVGTPEPGMSWQPDKALMVVLDTVAQLTKSTLISMSHMALLMERITRYIVARSRAEYTSAIARWFIPLLSIAIFLLLLLMALGGGFHLPRLLG